MARVVASTYTSEEGAEQREGAGGVRTFTLRGVRPGATRMTLVEVFGDGGREPVGRRRLTVRVR